MCTAIASLFLPTHPAQAPSKQPEPNPGDFLCTYSPRLRPWDDHRLQADQVTDILALGLPHHQRQAERMRLCAHDLEFGWVIESLKTSEARLSLKSTWFCRVRTCPVCQWRRAKMWTARFYRAFPKIYQDHPDLRYILLTLTVRNCPVLGLRQTIREMNEAWQRMTQRAIWPAVGSVRSLEVTRGKDGSAHPHFHCLLAVRPNYFGRNYLSVAKWATLWQEALRIDYTPIVDVRIVKPKPWKHLRDTSSLGRVEVMMDEVRTETLAQSCLIDGHDPCIDSIQLSVMERLLSAITEVIKYTVKPDDMVFNPSWFLELSDQLRNCRAVALGGIMREYLSEKESGEELIGNEDTSKHLGEVYFGWREDPRFAQYKRKSVKSNEGKAQ